MIPEPLGVGIISDAQGAVRILKLKGISKAVLVSSTWHRKAAEPVWQYLCQKNGIEIQYEDCSDDAGEKTKKFYSRYARVTKLAFSYYGRLFGLHRLLEALSYIMQKNRKREFYFDGYG